MKRENRVYVTNAGGHDFNPAKKYGIFVPLTKGNINPTHTDRITIDMLETLKDSSPDDYLLLSGHPVTILIATTVMFSLHEKIKFLVWNKYSSDYSIREISKKQIMETLSINFK